MFFFKKKIIITIPIYKAFNNLKELEIASLKRCLKTLSDYPICFFTHKKIDIDSYKPLTLPLTTFSVIYFDESFFTNKQSYNRLMLSRYFYKKFLGYERILIYQLDSYIISDNLQYWLGQKYDYIGAPWLSSEINENENNLLDLNIILDESIPLEKKLPLLSKQLLFKVGNGGLSIRNPKLFLKILKNKRKIVAFYLKYCEQTTYFNEDVFWSIEANRYKKELNIPNYKISTLFSIENDMEIALSINENKLPFGIHAWDKHYNFWKNILNHKDLN